MATCDTNSTHNPDGTGSILYIVATPIGNLEDITLRAIKILKTVDIIACEDTRQTLKLLNHYNIKAKCISFHSYNESKSASKILSLLEHGKNIALVSDGGTPAISDPGALLVNKARERGCKVVPVPGASALSTLLSVAGEPINGVIFQGFLPRKTGKRIKRLKKLLETEENFVVYESPYRIIKLLEEINRINPDVIILLGREMTKMYEEFLKGTPEKLLTILGEREKIKGEISIFIYSGKKRLS